MHIYAYSLQVRVFAYVLQCVVGWMYMINAECELIHACQGDAFVRVHVYVFVCRVRVLLGLRCKRACLRGLSMHVSVYACICIYVCMLPYVRISEWMNVGLFGCMRMGVCGLRTCVRVYASFSTWVRRGMCDCACVRMCGWMCVDLVGCMWMCGCGLHACACMRVSSCVDVCG